MPLLFVYLFISGFLVDKAVVGKLTFYTEILSADQWAGWF